VGEDTILTSKKKPPPSTMTRSTNSNNKQKTLRNEHKFEGAQTSTTGNEMTICNLKIKNKLNANEYRFGARGKKPAKSHERVQILKTIFERFASNLQRTCSQQCFWDR
jgi:flagellar motor switch protein FliM